MAERQTKIRLQLGKVQTHFTRTLYPQYQKAQEQRWVTLGKSEEAPFPKPSSRWTERKVSNRKRDGNQYPGGDRPLTYTGRLSRNVIGIARDWHVRLITPKKFVVGIKRMPYAGYVDDYLKEKQAKSFMSFSPKTVSRWKLGLITFLKKEFGGRK